MKKFFKLLVLIFLVMPAMFILTACGSPTVINIQKTNTTDNATIYTVYYSDGSTSSITVQNGKDGQSIDVEALYELGVTKGYYTDDLEGYQKFLTDLVNGKTSTVTTDAGVSKAMQSAVSIYAQFPVYGSTGNEILCGAGVIYKMDSTYSYIITNYHVLYYSGSLTSNGYPESVYVYQYGTTGVALNSSNQIVAGNGGVKCSYIGGSMNYDIAILRANTSDLLANNSTARAVDIATGYTIGDTVYAIGNPMGEGTSITKGIVSVLSEDITMESEVNGKNVTFRVLRMDTAINGGNSGGGVFNQNGELVGIANAKRMIVSEQDTSAVEGMAYALPYDNVTKVADNIMYYYSVQNSFSKVLKLQLGITYKVQNSKQVYSVDGKLSVVDEIAIEEEPKVNSIAKLIGIKKGDIITHLTINDKVYKINRSFELSDLLLTVRVGDVVVLTYTRDGVADQNSGSHTISSTELAEID